MQWAYPPAGLWSPDPDVGGLDDVVDEMEAQQIRINHEAIIQLSPRYGLHIVD